MYAVTAATGRLGRLVIDELLRTLPSERIVAAVRNPAKATDLAAKGVQVRHADYNRPETWDAALKGVDRLLLISSDAIGMRRPQHQTVIDAAKGARVQLLAYTSILHADTTPAKIAADHKATESAIAAAGLPAALLRNGWYTENFLLGLQSMLERGAMVGAAGEARLSMAARADYAAAAAKVLTADGQAGQVYELAGDEAYTLSAFIAELSQVSGRPVVYRDLSETDYKGVLVEVGLPEALADILADAQATARAGTLYDDSGTLSRLIGRPTTSVRTTLAAELGVEG